MRVWIIEVQIMRVWIIEVRIIEGLLYLCDYVHTGQASIQLDPLENKSEIHSVLDLLDERGRKPVGGKLEVFVRLREPLTGML
jgi:coiled-coil and C2 domain-containing protein 1